MENIEKCKNKPVVVFGDIHGFTYWKKAVAENPDCRYIFLGDYLDPYENISCKQLIDNLKEIIKLKKDRNDDVILLLGNHDLHYFCAHVEICTRYNYVIAKDASELFRENNHLFMNAFQEGERIFNHAGISEKWFLYDFGGNTDKNIAEQLNNPRSDQLSALYQCGARRGGSFNKVGGIFWIDINELLDPLPGFTQFVGHNRVRNISEYENNGGKIVFCDCLFNNIWLKLE
jgi:hypothetical protein